MKSFFFLPVLLAAGIFCKADEKPAAATKTSTGLVFKVQGKKAPFYLCGSFHLLKKEDYPLPSGFEKAYAASSRLVFEIPPGDMKKPESLQLMMKLAMLADGELKDHVSEKTMKALTAWGEENGMPQDVFAKMQPWMAGLTIAQAAYAKLGMTPEFGLDMHFGKRAAADKKSVEGFETVAFQLGLFGKLSKEVQDQMILQAIEEAAEAAKTIDELHGAWVAGDPDRLAALMEESFKDYPDVKKSLLDERNARWIKPLESYLEGEETVMVIVGAGHLCGKGSVVDLLRKKGWKVE